MPQVVVAGVLPPALSELAQIGLGPPPPPPDHGTNARLPPPSLPQALVFQTELGVDPRETACSRSARQLQQNCLGLVIESVGSGSFVEGSGLDELREQA